MAQTATALGNSGTVGAKRPGGSAAVSAPRPPWILNWWRDLLFFVGTPLLLLPLATVAQTRWTAQDIYLFVGAFGAMGHHLPGMIRAYGDRALFARFRLRFVVAPLVLLTVCILCTIYGLKALEVVAFTWGIWHGMMQTYGFCRIYDVKVAAGAVGRARADFYFCFAWFVAVVVLSPMRLRSFLDFYYESGGLIVTEPVLQALRAAAVAALALVSAVFVWQHFGDWRRGRGVSLVKLALLASSISFWWYCNIGVANILVGIALFEIFHDVQYLTIVWSFNRNRVERDSSIGGFLRFVFRRSGALIGLYVGLVLAYGSIGLVAGGLSSELIRQVLLGCVTASALLHFYYDGFIWKVRERATRESLGLDQAGGPADVAAARRSLAPWMLHGLRWAVLALPFAVLCAIQLSGRTLPLLERRARVAEVLPQDAQAQLNYGKALHEVGQLKEAMTRYESARKLNPTLDETEFFLGLAYSDLGEIDTAMGFYRRSLELNPKNPDAECNLAGLFNAKGKPGEARRHYERSLELKPRQVLARKELADLQTDNGEYDAAVENYLAALKLKPDFAQARTGLALARSMAKK